jgi:hypothetical protein
MDQVERGKAAIVEHMMETMRGYSIESMELVFQWKEDVEKTSWSLSVYRGKERRQLEFRGQDVEAWAESPEVAGKYQAAILNLVDGFLKKG